MEGKLSGNEVLSLWVTGLEVILQSLLLHSTDESTEPTSLTCLASLITASIASEP